MPPGAFPSDSSVGQVHLDFEELPATYLVRRSQPFGDGGSDVSIGAQTKVRRFRWLWDGLTSVQAGILDTHKDDAKYSDDEGSAYGFNITTPAGETVANVFYAKGGYKASHSKTWVHRREIELIKYP